MTPEQFKRKYDTVEKIPVHIFADCELTKPVGDELQEFLRFLLHNEPETLRYLHRKGQEYVDYGGAQLLPFERWKSKLTTSLKK